MSTPQLKAQQFSSLIKISRMRSESLIAALKAHLVKGEGRAAAARAYNIDLSYLCKSIKRLKQLHTQALKVAS